MNPIKLLILIVLFSFFAILQNSFFTYFSVMGSSVNLVFILFFILIFFYNRSADEKESDSYIILLAVVAGFFLDLFLPIYFGVSIISLLIIYIIEKFITHLMVQNREKNLIFYFICMFSLSFIVYQILLYISLKLLGVHFLGLSFSVHTLGYLIYNLCFACIGFYLYKKFFHNVANNNQLKLL